MKALSPPELDAVAALLARRTGLVFPRGRQAALATAGANALSRAGARDARELVALLDGSPAALDELVAEVTIHESYFFRAPEQFDLLRRVVLPEILQRRGPEHRPRILSAGCSAGEEPYSLAILLEEEGLGARSHVVGTDISRPALARAADALFGEWSLRASSAELRARWFRREGARYRLRESIRDRVELAYLNLGEDRYPSHATGIAGFDVIFCRNALIYFSPEMVARVAPRLFATLADGGWLFTGASDPPLGAHAPFETVSTDAGVVYRRAARGVAPSVLRPPARALPLPPLEEAAPARPALPPVEPAPPPPRREAGPPAAPLRAPPAQEEEDVPEQAAGRIRALADAGRVLEALAAAADAARRFPLSAEVHYLHAVALGDAGREREAADSLRRALYTDERLAVAALALGLALRRLGDRAGAARSLRKARALLAARPADEVVPLTDGERAGRLLVAVDVQLRLLGEAS